MALDDVVRTTITGPRIEEAMYRTLRWIDRCIAGNLLLKIQHSSPMNKFSVLVQCNLALPYLIFMLVAL